MLRLNPEKRAKAGELIHHAWLDGIVVQGEVDVIRRAEEGERKARVAAEEERERRMNEGGSGGGLGVESTQGGGVSVSMREVDAMKPVGETDDGEGDGEEGGGEDSTAQAQHQQSSSSSAHVPRLGVPVPSSAGAKENARGHVPTLGPISGKR